MKFKHKLIPLINLMIFEHPYNVCMSYLEHMVFSLEMSAYFALGSIRAIVHAFVPDLCITSTTDITTHIQKRLAESGCRNIKD